MTKRAAPRVQQWISDDKEYQATYRAHCRNVADIIIAVATRAGDVIEDHRLGQADKYARLYLDLVGALPAYSDPGEDETCSSEYGAAP